MATVTLPGVSGGPSLNRMPPPATLGARRASQTGPPPFRPPVQGPSDYPRRPSDYPRRPSQSPELSASLVGTSSPLKEGVRPRPLEPPPSTNPAGHQSNQNQGEPRRRPSDARPRRDSRPLPAAVTGDPVPGMPVIDAYNEGVRRQKINDLQGAVKYYAYAAERGHPKAQHNLASMYEHGVGVAKDDVEAVRLFREAAAKGIVESQFSVAMHYKDGTGVDQDLTQCILYLNKAADQGHAKALYNLGLIYERGQGIEADLERARLCYTEAAALGNIKAAVNLGVLFAEGRGVETSPDKAVKWFKMAAEKGDASAMFNLSLAYQSGLGVDRDEAEAVRLLETAAERSHPKAQFNLARRLLTGDGIEKNEHRARMLLMVAADSGERKAARTLRVLKHKEPPIMKPPSQIPGPSQPGVAILDMSPARSEGRSMPPVRPTEDAVARVRAAAERKRRESMKGLGDTASLMEDMRPRVSSDGAPDRDPDLMRRRSSVGQEWHYRRRSLWVDLRRSEPEDDRDDDGSIDEGDATYEHYR